MQASFPNLIPGQNKAKRFEDLFGSKDVDIEHMRGTPDVTSALINSNNLLYTGTVYIGSDKQSFELIFDTGSDWLVVEDLNCATCESKRFNKTTSTTFEVNSTATKALNYGSASLKGYTGNDTVGLDST
jgi:Eukaryotic aspartyl protease